jgi:hypothetical protein
MIKKIKLKTEEARLCDGFILKLYVKTDIRREAYYLERLIREVLLKVR